MNVNEITKAIIGEAVVVEIKAVERLAPVQDAQLLTYSRFGRLEGGSPDQF